MVWNRINCLYGIILVYVVSKLTRVIYNSDIFTTHEKNNEKDTEFP